MTPARGALARLRAAWEPVRRALVAVGTVLGTVNTAILLGIVYLTLVPWIRLGLWIRGRDVLGTRRHERGESSWVPLDGAARAPTLEDLENQF